MTALLDQSLIQKRNSLFKNISSSYAQAIQQQVHKSCTKTITQINEIIIDCDPPSGKYAGKNVCELCISKFYPAILTNTDEENEKYINIINQYRDGVCNSLCSCDVSNVSLDNYLNVSSSCKINPKNLNQDEIVQNILNDLQNISPNMVSKTDITKMVESTITSITQDINQVINLTETIEVKGHGVMSGITVKDISNIIFKALAQFDGSQTLINQLVDNLMSEIKQEVNKEVVENIGEAFEKSKSYFIGTGIVLGISIVLIVVLLIIKAVSSKN